MNLEISIPINEVFVLLRGLRTISLVAQWATLGNSDNCVHNVVSMVVCPIEMNAKYLVAIFHATINQ